MNTRSIEPRNFWGLTVQNGPWKTTSIDETHLAQGYDSPHNNRQFVTPYQQDGTATIPDQQYTRLSIIEPSADLHFKNGKIKKAKKGFSLNIIPEGFLTEKHVDAPNEDVTMANIVDTSAPANTLPVLPRNDEIMADADTNMAANSRDNPSNSELIGSDGNSGNSIVQIIQQAATSSPEQIATAQNAWTQPAGIRPSIQSSTPEMEIVSGPKPKVFTPATTEGPIFSKWKSLGNVNVREDVSVNGKLRRK
jgi:hypothetical protein